MKNSSLLFRSASTFDHSYKYCFSHVLKNPSAKTMRLHLYLHKPTRDYKITGREAYSLQLHREVTLHWSRCSKHHTKGLQVKCGSSQMRIQKHSSSLFLLGTGRRRQKKTWKEFSCLFSSLPATEMFLIGQIQTDKLQKIRTSKLDHLYRILS